jgi:hypothetical protein
VTIWKHFALSAHLKIWPIKRINLKLLLLCCVF